MQDLECETLKEITLSENLQRIKMGEEKISEEVHLSNYNTMHQIRSQHAMA